MVYSPPTSSLLYTLLILLCLLAMPSPQRGDDMDATGKKVTFYPSSLMLSNNVKPLIFFSDTRLMHLTTRLRPISAGPTLTIQNNCSISQLLHNYYAAHLRHPTSFCTRCARKHRPTTLCLPSPFFSRDHIHILCMLTEETLYCSPSEYTKEDFLLVGSYFFVSRSILLGTVSFHAHTGTYTILLILVRKYLSS